MDLARIRADVVARRGHWRDLSTRTGLSLSWLSKFANDRIGSPRIITIERLQAALSETAKEQQP